MRLVLAAIATFAVVAGARGAHALEARRVGVIATIGSQSPDVLAALDGALDGELAARINGVRVMSAAAMAKEIASARKVGLRCSVDEPACARQLAVLLELDYVAVSHVTGAELEVALIDARSSDPPRTATTSLPPALAAHAPRAVLINAASVVARDVVTKLINDAPKSAVVTDANARPPPPTPPTTAPPPPTTTTTTARPPPTPPTTAPPPPTTTTPTTTTARPATTTAATATTTTAPPTTTTATTAAATMTAAAASNTPVLGWSLLAGGAGAALLLGGGVLAADAAVGADFDQATRAGLWNVEWALVVGAFAGVVAAGSGAVVLAAGGDS